MKSRSTIAVAVSLVTALVVGYWLGYQRGSNARLARNNMLTSLRQVGLAFRGGHNDIARFQMTGDVIVTKTNGQGR